MNRGVMELIDTVELAVSRGIGHAPREVVAEALGRIDSLRNRKGHFGEVLVVALAGGTGSGKSSVVKAGVLPADTDAFVTYCRDELGLTIAGLMCIPPFDEEPSLHFALLGKIAKRNGLEGLSMGMSGDFETAIALGATHVRVGSAIFGERMQRIA